MRAAPLLFLVSILAGSRCNAQEPAPEADLGASLTNTNFWHASSLPAGWKTTSTNAQGRTLLLTKPGHAFGAVPEQVQAYYDGPSLSEVTITYLEAGNFFAGQQARDMGSKKAQKEFQSQFKTLEELLLKELAACFGPGRRGSVGKSKLLRSRVTEFSTGELVIRLFAEDDQLISLSILAEEAATKKLLTIPEGQAGLIGRRKEVLQNVEKLPNGDVVIRNIPSVDQGGRGYCAMGTLTMLTRYYGLPINIDLVAAKAGYREGDVENADVEAMYLSCAKEAKLRLKVEKDFDFRKAKKFILKGEPVIVGRKFDRVRDDYHTTFAQQFSNNPTARLPKPDRNERARWPSSIAGAHASVITGFNDERDEVIFTESWGEAARNRRMHAEEMEATALRVYYFSP
jgi:hypothetical protein